MSNRDAQQRLTWPAIALIVVTAAVFAQVRDHAFVEFEDPGYVVENVHIRNGLDLDSLRWAFTNRIVLPLTWVSHALDVGLYGLDSAGPHALTNVALHVANTLLLLFWLSTTTRQPGCSFFVAGLFALHPMHVESVAWVSARKDVLSTFFLFLMLIAWSRWVEHRSRSAYGVALGSLALGLMAKPILVSAPVLLLFLDVWPFDRLGRDRIRLARLRAMLVEKLPFFGLALLAASIVLLVTEAEDNFWASDPPLVERLAGAAIACVAYLGKLAWPVGLAIAYPSPAQQGLGFWPLGQVVGACAVLVLISFAALRLRERAPELLVGWLWFLALLFPVLHVVPSGLRVLHDRYTYVSGVGVFLAVSFGVARLAQRYRVPVAGLRLAGLGVLAACAVASAKQVAYWRDTDALLDHTEAVTERNAIVHSIRGTALAKRGRWADAAEELERALAIRSDLPDVHNNLGHVRAAQGRIDEAIEHDRQAIALRPGFALATVNLGSLLLRKGRVDEAVDVLERAVALAPGSAEAHSWLATACMRRGDTPCAEQHYGEALARNPRDGRAKAALALLRERAKRPQAGSDAPRDPGESHRSDRP